MMRKSKNDICNEWFDSILNDNDNGNGDYDGANYMSAIASIVIIPNIIIKFDSWFIKQKIRFSRLVQILLSYFTHLLL